MVGSDELKSRLAPSHKLLSFYFRVILTERIGESHVPNLTDDLGTAKERYGSFSLVRQKFDRVCQTLLKLDTRYSVLQGIW